MSWGVSSDAIDTLFTSTFANTQANLDSLAGTVLGQGIDHFQNGKYEMAVRNFKRAAALSPSSDNAAKAYDFLGQSYLKLEKTDEAIKTYREAIRLYPANDTYHVALGDIYLQQEGMEEEALLQYKAAVQLNPTDAETRYSLGQSYLKAGNLDDAREQFSAVVRLTPASAAGYYGLGEVARTKGDGQEAIARLTKAISVNKNFEIAYVGLAYAYADQGEFDKAAEQLSILKDKGSNKAIAVQGYIEQAKQPRILMVQSPNGFNTSLGPKTEVAALHPSLTGADKAKLFSLNFAFSKDMDEASVTSPNNWTISRATIQTHGGVYNYGLSLSSAEAIINPAPLFVTFNEENNMATVNFLVKQNAQADATIDPRHLVFKFQGVDTYGKTMDPDNDEYSGFNGVA